MRRSTSLVFAAFTSFAASPITPSRADVIFDTTPAFSGGGIGTLGKPNAATFGQTFVAPTTATELQSFTFYLGAPGSFPLSPGPLQIQAQIYAWSGVTARMSGHAVGSALYTSSPFEYTITNSFMPISVNTGGVDLNANENYIAFFTISGPDPTDYTNSTGLTFLADVGGFAANDGGGAEFFLSNGTGSMGGTGYNELTTTNWEGGIGFPIDDLEWKAVFTAPEPASLSLFGAALAGLSVVRRRKRKGA